MFEVNSTIGPFLKALNKASNAVGFAKVVALTRTARATAKEWFPQEVERSFDRPTAYIRNAAYFQSATSSREEFLIGIKNQAGSGIPASRPLGPEVFGGERTQKRSEKALTEFAAPAVREALAGRGYWVPGPGAPKDAYGNVPGSFVRRVIAALRNQADPAPKGAPGRKRRKTKAAKFFVVKSAKGSAPGIWTRQGSTIVPVFLFVRSTNYHQRFDFFGKGMRFAEAQYLVELEKAMLQGFDKPKA